MTADATGLMAQDSPPRGARRPKRTVRDPIRRRRWRIFRWSLLVAVVLVSAAIWIAWFSSVLVIRKVEVSGVSGILVNRVLESAEVPIGLQMARLDVGEVNAGIATLPWVQSSAVVRAWPRGVVLIVQPRVAVAELEGSSAVVASDGAVFVPPEPIQPGLPKIRGDGVGIVTAVRVLETIPQDLRSRVALISATTRDDAEIFLDSGIAIRWGSAERPMLKARVLAALMKTRARVYDVSAPELPTTIGQRFMTGASTPS